MLLEKCLAPIIIEQLLICSDQGVQLHKEKPDGNIQIYLTDHSIRAMAEMSDQKCLITTQNFDRFVLVLKTQNVKRIESGECNTNYSKLLALKILPIFLLLI